jgi:hypothetical protein
MSFGSASHATERLDWLERAAAYAVLLSGSQKDGGFYVSIGTAYTRGLRPSLREAIDALATKGGAA